MCFTFVTLEPVRTALPIRLARRVVLLAAGCCLLLCQRPAVAEEPAGGLLELQRQVARQKTEIEELKAAVAEQRAMLERLLGAARPAGLAAVTVTPSYAPATASAQPAFAAAPPAAPAQSAATAVSAAQLAKETERVARSLGGFQFSGDFRYRLDLQLRSANDVAPALQNARGRYRVRLNIDKGLDSPVDPRLKFHLQLSTGPYQVQTTNDQDFAGLAAKQPFSVAEAYINYSPTPRISLRGGRSEEVFADNMKFLWDDDVRFNGFHQIVTIPVTSGALGINKVEFRSGEYILSNPNITALAANSPYTAAGYIPGQKVRTAKLFHPGVILTGSLGPRWSHYFQGDLSLYHNPNQIQLASTAAGFPAVMSTPIGVQLPAPAGAAGNATLTPGGAMYSARHYQIAHGAYRLERKSVRVGNREMPLWFDFQASRNAGASKLRDAFMASANLGSVKRSGDLRFLYQFALKDANSLISQFTDDDLGTGTGVNLAVHALRVDLGLTRYLQWQNLLFIQTERRPTSPSEQMYMVLQRGANPTFRFLGQLAFTF